jgi:hypothetical protein
MEFFIRRDRDGQPGWPRVVSRGWHDHNFRKLCRSISVNYRDRHGSNRGFDRYHTGWSNFGDWDQSAIRGDSNIHRWHKL